MTEFVHLLLVADHEVAGVRALIESRLGVETEVADYDGRRIGVQFKAPHDVNLDFLRPGVLPPKPNRIFIETHGVGPAAP